MKLYRPVGFLEMDLILNTGCRRYPPRLVFQPIFYPVLNEEYAIQIAKQWNVNDNNSGYAGYVTEFDIDDNYIARFEPHQVGAQIHKEYWIPAEELQAFNSHIKSNIFITKAYYGSKYQGLSQINTAFKNKSYQEQLVYLYNLKKAYPMDFACEVLAQWKIITQNYFLWQQPQNEHTTKLNINEKEHLLESVKKIMQDNIKWFIRE